MTDLNVYIKNLPRIDMDFISWPMRDHTLDNYGNYEKSQNTFTDITEKKNLDLRCKYYNPDNRAKYAYIQPQNMLDMSISPKYYSGFRRTRISSDNDMCFYRLVSNTLSDAWNEGWFW